MAWAVSEIFGKFDQSAEFHQPDYEGANAKMRTKASAILIFAVLLGAASACGSDTSEFASGEAMVGEWSGNCVVTNDENGSQVANDRVTVQFTEDGKYFQSIEGFEGGRVEGTYTATDQTINLSVEGDSADIEYAVEDGVLTTTRQETTDVPLTSTCTLRPASG